MASRCARWAARRAASAGQSLGSLSIRTCANASNVKLSVPDLKEETFTDLERMDVTCLCNLKWTLRQKCT